MLAHAVKKVLDTRFTSSLELLELLLQVLELLRYFGVPLQVFVTACLDFALDLRDLCRELAFGGAHPVFRTPELIRKLRLLVVPRVVQSLQDSGRSRADRA